MNVLKKTAIESCIPKSVVGNEQFPQTLEKSNFTGKRYQVVVTQC